MKRRKHSRSLAIRFVVLVASLIGSCSVLRLYDPVKIQPEDWVMYGGNVQRTHVANYTVRLPLIQVWEYDTNAGFGNNSVAVADSFVFVGTLQGELHVVRIGTGKRVGSTDLGSAIVGMPVVAGELVYVPLSRNDDNLVAFNLQRGALAWRVKVSDIETSPLFIENKLYVTTLRGELLCLERFSGEIAWRFEIPSHDHLTSIRSSPAADAETIFFGADDGKLYAVRMQDGKLLWAFATGQSIVATPSVSDGRVFFGSTDNSFYSLDASTGKLVWTRNVGSRFLGGQVVDRGRVFVGTADGRVYCFDANTGDILWRFQTGSVISAAPLSSGSMVFIGSSDKHLYALDAMSGQLEWSKEFTSRIKTSPVAWRNYLIVMLEDRRVVAFQSQGETPS